MFAPQHRTVARVIATAAAVAISTLGVAGVGWAESTVDSDSSPTGTTSDNAGVANGNQVTGSAQLPLGLTCNAIAALGDAAANCPAAAPAPTPTPAPSGSVATPSTTASTSAVTNRAEGQKLADTGAATPSLIAVGGTLVVAGVGIVVMARRRTAVR